MNQSEKTRVKRGRPRSGEKRRQIMSAAMELFTSNGFEGTSVDELDLAEPPEQMLPEIASRFLQLITSPEATRVHAVCTGSADTHPELGQIYFEHGPLQTVEAVATYLEAQDKAQNLRVENPRHAAWQFLCMLKAEEQLRTQFNIGA